METFVSDLSNALPSEESKLNWYVNNLKSNNEFHKLSVYHFCLKDCDAEGNIISEKGKSAKDYVFVKFFAYEEEYGSSKRKTYLSCEKCNEDSETLRQMHLTGRSFDKQIVEERKANYCIHCR